MQTKIVVIKRKQLFLFGAAAIVIIFLILLMFGIFREKKTAPPLESPKTMQGIYLPGSYSSDVTLGDYRMRLQILVDSDRIKNVSMTYLDEAAETMYPLIPSSLEHLNAQFSEGLTPAEVTLSEESRYTESYLLTCINELLSLALLPAEST